MSLVDFTTEPSHRPSKAERKAAYEKRVKEKQAKRDRSAGGKLGLEHWVIKWEVADYYDDLSDAPVKYTVIGNPYTTKEDAQRKIEELKERLGSSMYQNYFVKTANKDGRDKNGNPYYYPGYTWEK